MLLEDITDISKDMRITGMEVPPKILACTMADILGMETISRRPSSSPHHSSRKLGIAKKC